jgi:hypothetical protein
MEVAAVLLARAMAYVESSELNPQAGVFYPNLVRAIVARYNFQKFPQKPEDFDEAKGVVFAEGRLGDSVIEQLAIYTYGIILDTRTSTQESRRLLEEGLQWASKEMGLVYKPSMIKRWQYASNLIFYSKVPLTGVHSAFQKVADSLTRTAAELTGEKLKYELVSFGVNYDQLNRKHPFGSFSIQRRENVPFSENKYFSDAPLPTDVHMKLLEQFEADISNK